MSLRFKTLLLGLGLVLPTSVFAYQQIIDGAYDVMNEVGTSVTEVVDEIPSVEDVEQMSSSMISDVQASGADIMAQVQKILNGDLSGIDLAAIKDMAGMFLGDSALASAVGVNSAEVDDPHSILDEFGYAAGTDIDIATMFDCSEWNYVGVCFSWKMTWSGPRFYTNMIVENYSRDTHIEVRESTPPRSEILNPLPRLPGQRLDDRAPSDYFVGGIPAHLTGMLNQLIDPLTNFSNYSTSDLLRFGAEAGTRFDDDHQYLFREVEISGNPEAVMYDLVVGNALNAIGWCKSPNMPLVPYFSSSLDWLSWRLMPTTEMLMYAPYAAQYGIDDIGNNYGSTLPRVGRIETPSPFKAAVIAATRGFHVVANNQGPYSGLAGLHVHVPMSDYSPGSWRKSFYKTKMDTSTLKLEMVFPFQGEKCTYYRDSSFLADERELKFKEGNDYNSAVFKGYRPFRCCRKKGRYITHAVISSPKL